MDISIEEVKELPCYISMVATGRFVPDMLATQLQISISVVGFCQRESEGLICLMPWRGTPQHAQYWSLLYSVHADGVNVTRYVDKIPAHECVSPQFKKQLLLKRLQK